MKRLVFLTLILIALAGQRLSAETPASSPESVVSDLYKLEASKHGPFFQTKDHGVVTKYFADPLAQLIWKDAVTSKGEVGALDFDPLYGSQDHDIKKFSLRKSKSEQDAAEVIASFENMGRKTNITFSLVLTKAGWKISDIKGADGKHLIRLLGGKSRAATRWEKRIAASPPIFCHRLRRSRSTRALCRRNCEKLARSHPINRIRNSQPLTTA